MRPQFILQIISSRCSRKRRFESWWGKGKDTVNCTGVRFYLET